MRLSGEILKLDLYAILGVASGADVLEIRSAYRRQARLSHPDLNRRESATKEREMVDLNIAAWVLTDPQLRRHYDSSRQYQATGRSRAWYDRVCYGDTDWVVPLKPASRRPRSAELRTLLRRIRVWPGRAMLQVLECTETLTLRQRTGLTAFCFVAAALLISYARPRSLTKLFENDARFEASSEPISETVRGD